MKHDDYLFAESNPVGQKLIRDMHAQLGTPVNPRPDNEQIPGRDDLEESNR